MISWNSNLHVTNFLFTKEEEISIKTIGFMIFLQTHKMYLTTYSLLLIGPEKHLNICHSNAPYA